MLLTTLISQIGTFQTLISASISAFLVIIGIFIKEYFDKRTSIRRYVIDNGYLVNEKLRDNLKAFLKSGMYVHLYVPNKVSKEDKLQVNTSLESYIKSYEKNLKEDNIFSSFNEIESYQETFDFFEKEFMNDIRKVSKLSVPKVQKVATEIEDIYNRIKEEEGIINELFLDQISVDIYEMDHTLTNAEKSYVNFIGQTHKKIFWIQIKKPLLKLEKNIESFVKLKL